jgi:putative phosphoesterase
MKIGVISDTHGSLRPAAIRVLKGCSQIIHAGDLGDPKILIELKKIAPVSVVRGNIDQGVWAQSLPETEIVSIGNLQIYVLHNLDSLDLDPVKSGFQIVISGHTHKPKLEEKNNVRYLNPGSAGPRRFNLPITLAILDIELSEIQVRFVDLEKVEANPFDSRISFQSVESFDEDDE